MDAPNKIYLALVTLTKKKIIHEKWWVRPLEYANDNIEYIRKEALVEWIQTELKSCEGAAAMTRAYHKLIDKLISL